MFEGVLKKLGILKSSSDRISEMREKCSEFYPYLKELSLSIPVNVSAQPSYLAMYPGKIDLNLSEEDINKPGLEHLFAHELHHIVLGHTVGLIERLALEYSLPVRLVQYILDLEVSFFVPVNRLSSFNPVPVDEAYFYEDVYGKEAEEIAEYVSNLYQTKE